MLIQDMDKDTPVRAGHAVAVTDLTKEFGSFTALSELNFHIDNGEIFGLLGPNGSGKTTTLNIIAGLSVPTTGKVAVYGLNPREQSAAARRLMGVVPQETALYEELTAEKNLTFHAELFGIPRRERAEQVKRMLELAQLSDRAKSRVSSFSGGMKRRLAIARALLHDPKLVFLDEPTLGVDVHSRNMIWDYIRKTRDEGRSILLTTNYLEEANALCDRIAIIDHGRLVVLDTPTSLKTKYGKSVIEITLHTDVTEGLDRTMQTVPGVQSVDRQGPTLRLSLGDVDSGAVLPHLLQLLDQEGSKTQRLSLREPSLEEVFLALTGRGLRD
ncbi:putative ABC transporter ATP-binding protein YbhF [Peptococcaceae bacterium CEB3]|nr:putative ABC transporter ATP-binding protein YbhF [Peptococcaceae bacterium CEB3]